MKQLSKHNVTQYKQLCRELGRTFEAVPVEGSRSETHGIPPTVLPPLKPNLIFVDQIWNKTKVRVW